MPLIVTPRELGRRAEFYHQLSSLLRAGVPVLQAFEFVQRSPPSREYRWAAGRILERISQGSSLTEALTALPRWLPGFDLALIGAGETSGRLDLCLKLLAEYYRERARLAREIISNLIYPGAVLHLAILIFPTGSLTRLVMDGDIGGFILGKLAALIPLYIVLGAVAYGLQARRGESWRRTLERAAGMIPVLGSARSDLALSRLSAALESLLAAGVTIIEAWDLAAAASGSIRLRDTVASWRPAFVAGQTPGEQVHGSAAFPEMFASLYATGELSGQLEQTLGRLRDYYYEAGTRKLRAFAQWVPRALYMGVALFVAFKVFGFYNNYFQNLGNALNF